MSAVKTGGRRKKKAHHDEEHENEERWLVSFADMMTLLFALFMVLWSISSVNTSKFESLQKSLKDAFSGAVLDGGQSMMQTGGSVEETEKSAPQPPLPALTPLQEIAGQGGPRGDQAQQGRMEQMDLEQLKRRVDALAEERGLQAKVETAVTERGLVVRLLTDGVFFTSGSADLQRGAEPILQRIGKVIAAERKHPVVVEGHTDSQPIRSTVFPSNWELSGARAASVVREFARSGVNPRRMQLAGFGEQRPADSNSTASGRSKNRRVEIVLTRINPAPSTSSTGQGGRP